MAPADQSAPVPTQRETIPGQDEFLGGMFPPGLKFAGPGIVHTIVAAGIGSIQDRDYKTNAELFWPDGRPKMLMVIYGLGSEGTDVSWFVRGKIAEDAVKAGLRGAGLTRIAYGDKLTITRTADIEIPPTGRQKESVWANGYEVTVEPAVFSAT